MDSDTHPNSTDKIDVSVVMPVFNEAQTVEELHKRICSVFEDMGKTGEFIFVDDGSTDQSVSILNKLREADERIVIIRLSRNFGHQIAITAGIDHARGRCVVIMDADLQDPPEVIAQLVEKWEKGADVVNAVRTFRQGETVFKKMFAALFYRLLRRITNLDLPLDTGDFRLMDRRVALGLRRIRERHRYLRGIIFWMGFEHAYVHYDRSSRHAGTTKYPFFKSFLFAIDAITSFSFFPLRLATGLGLVLSVVSMGLGVYSIYLKLFTPDIEVPGWTALFVMVAFLGGVQLVILGIIGEYLGRTYEDVRARPLYYVSKIHGRTGEETPKRIRNEQMEQTGNISGTHEGYHETEDREGSAG